MPKETPDRSYPTIYVVYWTDNYYVMDGMSIAFHHSIHKTRKGAEAEAKHQREILRTRSKREVCGMKFHISKHGLLP